MFLVERSLAGLRHCLAQFLHKTLVQHAQMSHVGGITKGNVDVQGGKEHRSGQLCAARKCHEPRIEKKNVSQYKGLKS